MEVKQVFPLFEEGRILKRDSLDFIRDYAPDFFSLLFREYGNGVIAGFSVRGEGKDLVIGPGILKHGPYFFLYEGGGQAGVLHVWTDGPGGFSKGRGKGFPGF